MNSPTLKECFQTLLSNSSSLLPQFHLDDLSSRWETETHLLHLMMEIQDGPPELLALLQIARRYHQHLTLLHPPRNLKNFNQLERDVLSTLSNEDRFSSQEWIGFVAIGTKPCQPTSPSPLVIFQRGTRSFVNFEAATLFRRLLVLQPRAFYLIHNHPSGDPTPSQKDWDLTLSVAKTALALNTPMLGHWVVGAHGESLIPVTRPVVRRRKWINQSAIAAKRPSTSASARASSLSEQNCTR